MHNMNFIWWIGVVENIDDPLKIGRLRVRIINYHTENLNLLPSTDLPWAEVLFASNGSTYLNVKEEDWVIGFFSDGPNAQRPVVMGVLPAVKEIQPSTETGFSRQVTPVQILKAPEPAKEIVVGKVGEPTIPRSTRGIVAGTPIEIANNKREHVCDISNEMIYAASWVRIKFSEFMDAIRKAIRALLNTLGLSPDGVSSRFQELANSVVRGLKKVQKVLKDVQDATVVFNNFIKRVNELIKYILSLPATLLAMLQECLNNLYASLSKGFSELFKDIGGSSDSASLTEVVQEVQKTIGLAVETAGKAAESAALAASTVATVGVATQTAKAFKI